MESEESTFLGTDYIEQFKEKYNATALAKQEKSIFNNIAMKQLTYGDIESLLKGDLSIKHSNTVRFPSKGTTTGNLNEIWTLVEYFRNREKIRIYTSDEIPDYYVICWGKFGNEDIYVFGEYFEIKPEFKGWKSGLHYGI